MSRAEWATIGDKFLFTADITKPFVVNSIHSGGKKEHLKFDVVTAWEVLEHIAPADVPKVCENILSHLLPTGLVIMSISLTSDMRNGVELHQTIENEVWWESMFRAENFYRLPAVERYLNGQYVRGPKQGAPDSFHIALSQDPERAPSVPRLTRRAKILDMWLFSKAHRVLGQFVGQAAL